jgi:hypothetical protein
MAAQPDVVDRADQTDDLEARRIGGHEEHRGALGPPLASGRTNSPG